MILNFYLEGRFMVTKIPVCGIKVGNATDLDGATGCTVVLCESGAVCGVDVRGSSPGTRETDLLDPINFVDKINAILLAGGSAFGLDAASGIMRYLEERNAGFKTAYGVVPIVPGTVLFDLDIGDPKARPDAEMGYRACIDASNLVEEGNVGAGTGATVGKAFGPERATKGGLGVAAFARGRFAAAAIVAVNCLGDVVDPKGGEILAGALTEDKRGFVNTGEAMIEEFTLKGAFEGGNTTIGAFVSNAVLTKAQAKKVAQMAQDGLSITIRPAHTMYDGDTVFAIGTGEVEIDVTLLGHIASTLVAQAIVRAIQQTHAFHGVPSSFDIIGAW